MLTSDRVVKAYNAGYRVVNGICYSKTGNELKYQIRNGYPVLNIYHEGEKMSVNVHRLVAYRKYGESIFDESILVRHLDGNRLNFSEDNIVIGTPSDNMNDMSHGDKINQFEKVSESNKIHDHAEIKELRSQGNDYKTISELTGASMATISRTITGNTNKVLLPDGY